MTPSQYLVDRLANYGQESERTVLGPYAGIPLVRSVTAHVETSANGPTLRVQWESVDLPDIERYQVHVCDLAGTPQILYATSSPPALIPLPPNLTGTLTVRVQTVLTNGLTSSLQEGATATVALTAPPLQISSHGIYYTAGQTYVGTATLVAGTATVTCPVVTANSLIFLTNGTGWCRVSTRTPGTSFVITSSSGADTSAIGYLLINPAP